MFCFLVLVDLTPDGEQTFRYALRLAARLRASLVALHVLPTPCAATPVAAATSPALLQPYCALAQGQGVACTSEVSTGELATVFNATLARHRATAGILSLPSCPTAAAAVHALLPQALCPLLLVPAGYRRNQLPGQLAVAIADPRLALGWSIAAANALLQALGPKVVLTQIVPEPVEAPLASEPEALEALRQFPLVKDLAHVSLNRVYTKRRVLRELRQAVSSQRANWVVVPARRYATATVCCYGEKTLDIVARSAVPVLLVAVN